MEDRILTLHPDPQKAGVRIERKKYDQIRRLILETLQVEGPRTYTQLVQSVERRSGGFTGSLSWYVVTVKLDLEARGEIERTPGTPHKVKLIG